MKEIIKKKEPNSWQKELIVIKNFPRTGYSDQWWICDECRKIFEPDDFAMLWTKSDDSERPQLHCNLCGTQMKYSSEKYFTDNYVLK